MPLQPPPLHPPGWSSRSVSLLHCEAEGGTTGCWSIVTWYLPSYPAADPAPLARQPWFPIWAFVNDQAAATPVPVADVPGDLPPTPSVVCSGGKTRVRGAPPGGVVHQWGFFPASDLRARVLLAASGCLSGWGVWPLSWLELAVLWDVPILVSDSMSEESDILILWGFCASAPAKVLFAGADALLTTLFWRGSLIGSLILSRHQIIPILNNLHPHSHIDSLIGSLILSINKEVAGPSHRSNKDLGLVVSPPEARQDKNQRFATPIVKGDAQKADGAAVPDHLWIHALVSPPKARQDKNRHFATRVVKGNAQKADRAAVPDHLWIGGICQGGRGG
jgi:hypothetical protein